MLLERSFEIYKKNFKIALLFGLPLFVAAPLVLFSKEGALFSEGSAFIRYDNKIAIVTLILGLLFIAFQAIFVALIALAVRRELSKIDEEKYLTNYLPKFAFRVALFYVVFGAIFYAILLASNFSSELFIISTIALFFVSFLMMYTPQSIVVDELPLKFAILSSLEFVIKNLKESASILVLGSFMVAIIALIEFLLESFVGASILVSSLLFLATNIFVIPYIEVLKTYNYMLKYNIIKAVEKTK